MMQMNKGFVSEYRTLRDSVACRIANVNVGGFS